MILLTTSISSGVASDLLRACLKQPEREAEEGVQPHFQLVMGRVQTRVRKPGLEQPF